MTPKFPVEMPRACVQLRQIPSLGPSHRGGTLLMCRPLAQRVASRWLLVEGAQMSLAMWARASISMCARPLAAGGRAGWARGLWQSPPAPPHFITVPPKSPRIQNSNLALRVAAKSTSVQGGSTEPILLNRGKTWFTNSDHVETGWVALFSHPCPNPANIQGRRVSPSLALRGQGRKSPEYAVSARDRPSPEASLTQPALASLLIQTGRGPTPSRAPSCSPWAS